MHIAVPFSMDTVHLSFGKPNFTWGRAVANHSFLRALSDSATNHRISVFVPTKQDVETLKKSLLADFVNPVTVISFSEIRNYLRQYPIDILHVLDPNLWFGGHIRNFLSEDPFVVTGVTLSLGNEHFLQWALLNDANGIHSGDCLICVTPAAESVVKSYHSRVSKNHPDFSCPRTRVIPLGVNVDSFSKQARGAREQFGLDENDFVVLSLSRFNPLFKMDFLPLLNLMSLLKNRSKRSVKLILSGSSDDGSYTKFLQEQVAQDGLTDSVLFIFDPTDAQKAEIYRTADVFMSLIDNIQESFGLTVVEALSAGLPAVVSNWDGYKNIVEHGVTGYLIPTKTLPPDQEWETTLSIQPDTLMHLLCAQTTAVDLQAVCAALLELADDPELTRSMSAAAAKSAKRYDWSNVISRYVELWSELRDKQIENRSAPANRAIRSSAIQALHDFSYYPSSNLELNNRFVTSGLGKLLRTGEKTIQPYGQLAEILDWRLMGYLLQFFINVNSLQEAIDHLPGEISAENRKVSQNVMWLYKYGYLESV